MSVFSNICIGLLAAGTIAMILGLIGMEIADRRERKTAERLEAERKNGDADVFPEIEKQSQEEEKPQKKEFDYTLYDCGNEENGDATSEEAFQIVYPKEVVSRYKLYQEDCVHCRYGWSCPAKPCKGCDNAEVIDGEPICHCYDIIRVESKRPQCPHFKDEPED